MIRVKYEYYLIIFLEYIYIHIYILRMPFLCTLYKKHKIKNMPAAVPISAGVILDKILLSRIIYNTLLT